MTGYLDHLSPEKQWYWKMRGAYEDRYNQAGGSVAGLAMASNQPIPQVAKTAFEMGLIASWARAGISNKTYFEDERPPRDVLYDTISEISQQWDEKYRPVDEHESRFQKALDLSLRAKNGEIDNAQDFKQLMYEGEHAIISMQPDRMDDDKVRSGQYALHQVGRQILKDHPKIRDEIQKPFQQDSDRLLSSLSDHELAADKMNILAMSEYTKLHPAEVVGMGMANGIFTSDGTPQIEPFLSAKGRTKMGQAEVYPVREVLSEVVTTLSEAEMDISDRIKLRAAHKTLSSNGSPDRTIETLNSIRSSVSLNPEQSDAIDANLLGARAGQVGQVQGKVKASQTERS